MWITHTQRHHYVESLTPLLNHFLWDRGLPQKSTENHIVLKKNLAVVLEQALKNKCSLRNHRKTSQKSFPCFSWPCPSHTRATGQPGRQTRRSQHQLFLTNVQILSVWEATFTPSSTELRGSLRGFPHIPEQARNRRSQPPTASLRAS